MSLRASDLYSEPVIVGTAAELAEALGQTAPGDPVGLGYIPRRRQLIEESDTGTRYVGDDVTPFGSLTPLPGGATFPDFTGADSPEGVVTADPGKTYVDTTNGAVYFKYLGSDENGWAAFGVVDEAVVPGFSVYPAQGSATILGEGNVQISDPAGFVGSGNCIQWNAGGADGEQFVVIFLGSSGQFHWQFQPDGSTALPGVVSVAGALGVHGATPPAQSAHGTTAADAIACLIAHGFMAAS